MMDDKNNIEFDTELEENESIKIKMIILIVVLLFLVALITLGIFFNRKQTEVGSQSKSSLNSVEITGYELDNSFSVNDYEYNVTVEQDEIQVVCETDIDILGCNETINLKDKNTYTHKIILKEDDKERVYTININKVISEQEKKLRITSIEGNPLEWTNKDVTIKVNVESSSGIQAYSFDGGKTWQTSNELKVIDNQILNIVAKDKQGNITNQKQIKIDKIDRQKPTVEIVIQNKTADKINVKVISSDDLSGVNEITFNNSNYKGKDTFVVTAAGKYYAEVKDKAGNVSERVSIEIKSSDFVKESKENKTFTASFISNGSSTSSTSINCTTSTDSCKVTTPKIQRDGYEIIGWSTDKNATSATYKVNSSINLTKDQTYYAITKKTLTLKLDKNGSNSIGASSRTCTIYNTSTSCSVTFPTITRSGYDAVGWSTDKNATSATYKVNSSINLTKDQTYYAITKKTLTLKLDKNGADSIGASSRTCSIYNASTSCSVTFPTITRNSGTAIGWNTNKSATSATYNANSSINLTKDQTYYAITKKTLTLKLDKNGADSIGASSKTCTIYNTSTSCSVTFPTITRNSGTVKGWNTNKSATSATYKVNASVNLTEDQTYYAITQKPILIHFDENGAQSISFYEEFCFLYNTATSCSLKSPTITRSGWTIVGWNTNKNATSATSKVGENVSASKDTTYYAITKKVLTATFDSGVGSKTCTSYNSDGCSITLPTFNKVGSFNGAWGTNSTNPDPTYKVGTTIKLTNNINLYGSIKHPWGNNGYNYTKTRNLSISKTNTIGNVIFEYENGIPSAKINSHISFLNTVKSNIPWIFVPGKVFIMKHTTYNTYSTAYGLTFLHGSYAFIDLQYDSSGIISENATIHEMAHAWDYYYSFRTGKGNISDQSDFNTFYNSISSKLYVDGSGTKISKIETFAGMVTNYYWHILGKNTSSEYYALKSGATLNSTEKQNLKTLMEKYIKISNNNYK